MTEYRCIIINMILYLFIFILLDCFHLWSLFSLFSFLFWSQFMNIADNCVSFILHFTNLIIEKKKKCWQLISFVQTYNYIIRAIKYYYGVFLIPAKQKLIRKDYFFFYFCLDSITRTTRFLKDREFTLCNVNNNSIAN